LARFIEAFLAHKRALGRRFHQEEKELRLLDRFLVDQGVETLEAVTAERLEAFLASRPRGPARSYNLLLGAVRRLFDWLVAQEVLASSPLRAQPRRQTQQRVPFLFDPTQARRLLAIAGALPDRPRAPLRGTTYRTAFALLYGLGLRVGEVARLCVGDVDLERNLLSVRQTKFSKSRLVPFGPRVGKLLETFLEEREGQWGVPCPDAPVFSFDGRRAVHPGTLSQTFHQLVPRLELDLAPGMSPPRVHDLRHSFAVGTLLRWYRDGVAPQDRLLQLATFLGHVDPDSTAHYLTITADLLDEAHQRFERFAAPVLAEVRA
jgi:site-specific recombinase XerD